MRKIISMLPWLVFAGGFVLGVVVFFPMEQLRYPIQNIVAQTTRGDLQMGRVRLGTGLGLGLARGGLIAVHAENVMLTLNNGQAVECKEASISPRLLPLLALKASVAFRCILPKDASIIGVFTGGPIWSPKTGSVDLALEKVPLDMTDGFIQGGSLAGVMDGDVQVDDLDLRFPPGNAKITWNIKGDKVVLPAVANDFLKLPSIALGPLNTQGSYMRDKLNIDKLTFGNDKLPLQGQFKVNFGLDNSGMPTSGELSGDLRTDPQFEATQLKDAIKLDLIFGRVKEGGHRVFRKPVRGNVLSLMQAPVEN